MSKCTEQVLKYLVAQNRPYSANDVTENLRKEFSKGQVTKALEQLAQDGRIIEKENGKQKAYCALQPADDPQANPARELQELDANINSVTQNLRAVEQQIRESESLLKKLQDEPLTEDADAEAAAMEIRVQRLRTKLGDLTDNFVKVSPKDLHQVTRDHERMTREYRKRKRLCNDMLDKILEGYQNSKKSLMEDIGLETDEEVGFKM